MTASAETRLRWLVFTIAATAVFMMTLDSTLQPIALDAIGRSFEGSSSTALSWVLTSYNIAIAGLVVASGRIADRTGRRRTFLLGLLVFVAGSAGGAAAPAPAPRARHPRPSRTRAGARR